MTPKQERAEFLIGESIEDQFDLCFYRLTDEEVGKIKTAIYSNLPVVPSYPIFKSSVITVIREQHWSVEYCFQQILKEYEDYHSRR